ncbi:DDE-type integrase/transposase/recombinase [Achromobacter xylosoxidans]|uniref:DDE-type integrase/transposase/recombinase n=1 Tax=Alcaligenes xylosoxydans xylosoxydans TaxID=85698 RepID=UPI000B4929F0|nr:DDE-type integrase/transposase/recombinase [Achromobacter xylosoxidans]
MNAATTEELVAVARIWRDAPHGRKGDILAGASQRLGIARATLHRRLKEITVVPNRKRRSDAGQVALSIDDAKFIAAVLMEHMRKNGKRLKSIADAVEMLRVNGMIDARRIDPASGEVVELSDSAILRALRQYRLHPDQLLAPAPAVSLRSLHPNHVWQIDASRCVLYYLPKQQSDNGLRIADHTAFYKNKPGNLIKMINESLWRYVVTDHRSGALFLIYVIGGETGANLADVFIEAMCKREGEAFYGVPKMAMLDPGSANTGAVFQNLCKALQVKVQINKPGNPRAKGQVEKAQDISERSFESGLKLLAPEEVCSVEAINRLAAKWRRWFNGTRVHSRHGMTRDAAWLHIGPDELIIPPSADLMRELAVSAPEPRVVSTMLRVSYLGHEYDVSHVPGVIVGEKLQICRNPWRLDTAQAIGVSDQGQDVYHVLERVVKDEFGQVASAPVIGEGYQRHADTPVQEALKSIELLTTGADTLEQAEAVRKARALPFGGQIDPFKHINEAQIPDTMPRRGTAHDLVAPTVQLPPLTIIQAVKQIKGHFAAWSSAHYAWLQENYQEGVPADDLERVAAELSAAMQPQLQRTRILRVA